MKRIGILGGTFDPPHLGHLIIAEEVRLALELDEVWFIPTYTPPHKDSAKTGVDDRIRMTELAIETNPHFKINTIEIKRSGKSYTIDTMKELATLHPNHEFYFIIGADMVEYLPKWQDIDELVKLVPFVGVKRSGYELETEYDIFTVNIPLIDISSTEIRKRLQNNRSVNYLVPERVYAYIRGERLYGDKGSN
ncbi:nicotinate-nucleotide adenylyltransferase [Oceanobacillus alkalisoli]|uniref:nicotinate-nucleotide adenylyltransferase n=1 Tax=Oceanobacillus alkalisoli TaxID=2925113 RepID=UPI001EEF8D77|nr:nicotinate-nucleotide adenylyltransferase [Oceanobacillus alkalisoli]MCF3941831.1 nicotinate-nucleotide adenylyltransferase [Oceanobacillus alkalisoli]MCG5103111.1 nicotinate-nucleotide adenylyltransferase [Oceanobacillus alkalisoli]